MSEDRLRLLADELRGVFRDERRAIAKLDHATLDVIAARKRDLANALEAAKATVESTPETRALFASIRVEAQATAALAGAATDAIRALLGVTEQASAYDRRANRSSQPLRILDVAV